MQTGHSGLSYQPLCSFRSRRGNALARLGRLRLAPISPTACRTPRPARFPAPASAMPATMAPALATPHGSPRTACPRGDTHGSRIDVRSRCPPPWWPPLPSDGRPRPFPCSRKSSAAKSNATSSVRGARGDAPVLSARRRRDARGTSAPVGDTCPCRRGCRNGIRRSQRGLRAARTCSPDEPWLRRAGRSEDPRTHIRRPSRTRLETKEGESARNRESGRHQPRRPACPRTAQEADPATPGLPKHRRRGTPRAHPGRSRPRSSGGSPDDLRISLDDDHGDRPIVAPGWPSADTDPAGRRCGRR